MHRPENINSLLETIKVKADCQGRLLKYESFVLFLEAQRYTTQLQLGTNSLVSAYLVAR